eukprot:jgi/Botrbrau1/13240/Bobra.0199s0012.2
MSAGRRQAGPIHYPLICRKRIPPEVMVWTCLQDHIRQSTPVMLRCKTDLDNSNTEIQLGTYDADTDLGSVNEMKIVASATFKRLEDLLDGALEDVRELHAIASREAKARSASSSSLKRLLGRR